MTEVAEELEEEVRIKEPGLWKVIFHNDDKTTMEFVMFLLMQVFHKSPEEAQEITLQVHQKGFGIAGVFTHEVAENKMNVCINTSRQEGFPLNISIEEENEN
jgi:ATP-dependent Clp protease adaptor protein ClpS